MSFVLFSAGHQLTIPNGGVVQGVGLAGIAGTIGCVLAATDWLLLVLLCWIATDLELAGGSAAPRTKIVAKTMKSALRELLAPACRTRWRNIFTWCAPVSQSADRQSAFCRILPNKVNPFPLTLL